MPTPYIKKLADEGQGSVESLEEAWRKATSKAADQGKAEDYGLITYIFQHMINASTRLEAKQRLRSLHNI
jgi:hypothetical protein